jgi:hypothetical protein
MYKTKPRFPCHMPSDAHLNVLTLNTSLKHEPTLSNTGELASLVLDEIRALAPINTDVCQWDWAFGKVPRTTGQTS